MAPAFVTGFKTVLSIVKEVLGIVGSLISGLLKTLGGLIDFIMGAFTGDWKRAWQGVRDIFKGVFEALWPIVKAPLNLIIDGINALIDGLNSIKIDMPDWMEDMTGYTGFGISIPKVPKLAKGGLAYGPTLAMVGDNKGASVDPEVVSPLSKLQDMIGANNGPMLEVLTSILEAIRSNDKGAVLKIGETEFGRVAINAINKTQRQAGRTLLNL
ncbi:hypothetical protein J2Z69_000779 [Paenibacillus shirakamiensis]|uniref:Uncharacterized protein n=1 Tax=Paenibacillus shirakamiensis TaxID=1265935 RepID=A0ABS4JDF5_9BACL|nr:hypothetical protein [Paenibacillus shirakamiensis]MBP1999760.1 hypothetical protein [Paenibacillus shirakamiensis]